MHQATEVYKMIQIKAPNKKLTRSALNSGAESFRPTFYHLHLLVQLHAVSSFGVNAPLLQARHEFEHNFDWLSRKNLLNGSFVSNLPKGPSHSCKTKEVKITSISTPRIKPTRKKVLERNWTSIPNVNLF